MALKNLMEKNKKFESDQNNIDNFIARDSQNVMGSSQPYHYNTQSYGESQNHYNDNGNIEKNQ